MEGQPPLPPEPTRPSIASPAPSIPPLPPPPPGRLLVGSERPLVFRPMGIGELLDAAIRLYRAEWKSLMTIVAIVLVPITFLQSFLARELPGPFSPPDPTLLQSELESAIVLSTIFAFLTYLVIVPFLMAAIAKASTDIYLGHRVPVGPTFRFAIARIHSILWILFLYVLAAVAGFVILFLLGLATGEATILVIGTLAFIVPGVIVFVRLYFGPTVFVVEGLKGTRALGRSWRLSRRSFWRIFGTIVLTSIMTSIVQGILALPATQIAANIGSAAWPLAAIGNSLAVVVTTPFTTLVAVLLYFDLRIRKEAFDLEVMAQEMASSR
jgi:hypothetical protein